MRNWILNLIAWPFKVAVKVLDWTAMHLEDVVIWLNRHHKYAPRHRLAEPYGEDVWPQGYYAPERCPICESNEFALVWYEGELMCLVCRDDAEIGARGLAQVP
jgi:hypothetical protein